MCGKCISEGRRPFIHYDSKSDIIRRAKFLPVSFSEWWEKNACIKKLENNSFYVYARGINSNKKGSIIILPNLNQSILEYSEMLKYFTQRGMECFGLEPRGQCLNTCPSSCPSFYKSFKEDVIELLKIVRLKHELSSTNNKIITYFASGFASLIVLDICKDECNFEKNDLFYDTKVILYQPLFIDSCIYISFMNKFF